MRFAKRSATCACQIEVVECSPAAAVPVRTKIPEPMMAPIPSAVRLHGPSVFLSRCSGSSDTEISLSMDLVARSWLGKLVPSTKYPVPNTEASTHVLLDGRYSVLGTRPNQRFD